MSKPIIAWTILLTLTLSTFKAFAAPIDGLWEGRLQSGGASLRIVFNVSLNPDGSIKATMDSPDQGAYGVPVSQNLPVIEAALRAGGNKDFTVKEFPDPNHLFQQAKTGAPTEYVEIDETQNPKALETIGEWIVARTLKKSK